jgi:hypothetical protein
MGREREAEVVGMLICVVDGYQGYDEQMKEEALRSADALARVLAAQGELIEAERVARWMV